jgi:hypothetical protein
LESVDRQVSYSQFTRAGFRPIGDFTVIGGGALGGKASGLAFIKATLEALPLDREFPDIAVSIPTLTVIATEVFEQFLTRNALDEIAHSDAADGRIAHAFQQASLPAEIVGDLKSLIDRARAPLAIRSSSLLEDAMFRPFAGVYATKMIPNNQHDPDTRFRKLVEAIKLVYASTFFQAAKRYLGAAGRAAADEKMAVIIQEVVGQRHGDRFYPDVSGVARSYNFYPLGHAEPADGVVSLALGLGKTIVDDGVAWSYSPAYPRANPPYGAVRDLLWQTQTELWAVNMGKPPAYDPIAETEYLMKATLAEAESDGTLHHTASTYDPESDRLTQGLAVNGPRVVTFAPLLALEVFPLNALVRSLMEACEKAVGSEVEIEFAVTLPAAGSTSERARFGFLQVRPLAVSHERITIEPAEMAGARVLVASESALGNGLMTTICDIVYLKPEAFDKARTRAIAAELAVIDRELVQAGRPYLLIGFGRWGSSDPWLGVPVEWGQIAGAKVIVESTLATMDTDPSQGTHFFHNLSGAEACYFSVRHTGVHRIDWDWLGQQTPIHETQFVRHVRLESPLTVKVDGRTGRGVILRPA